jgi:hypothetical protein
VLDPAEAEKCRPDLPRLGEELEPPLQARVISRDTGRQFGFLPNMIQPPLLGVVNAASAVSARTLTWRAPAVPRSCSMLSVYMAVRVRPLPKLPPLEENDAVPRP